MQGCAWSASTCPHGWQASPALRRRACPSPPLTQRRLPLRAGALGGLVAWYSLINMPTEALPAVFAEFARVTTPDAPVLLAFQSGNGERVDKPTSYGQPVPLTYYRHNTHEVAAFLAAAGFDVYATVNRVTAQWFESTPQATLLAHRSEGG